MAVPGEKEMSLLRQAVQTHLFRTRCQSYLYALRNKRKSSKLENYVFLSYPPLAISSRLPLHTF